MRRFVLSLTMLAFVGFGCNKPAEPSKGSEGKNEKPTVKKKEEHDDHVHGAGPHGGTIIEFGKYHGEFCMDHGKKQATVYILSGNLKKGVPITSEKLLLSIKKPQFQVDLLPSPLEGEAKGESSRFIATHDNFAKEQEFEGTLSGVIDGKPYAGDFKEEEHKDEKKEEKKEKK